LKSTPWVRQRQAGAVLAVGAAASLLCIAIAPASASGATNPQAGKTAVPQGASSAVLKNAGVFGPTPPSTPETVSFVLKARNIGRLEASVQARMPGGYLSVSRFAHRFGQGESNISALEGYLAKFKITASAYADGLDITADGTAGEFDSALSVHQSDFMIPAVPARNGQAGRPAMRIHGTRDKALLPRHLARFVLDILGLTNYPTFASNAVHVPALAHGVRPSKVQTGSLTPADFAKQYRLNPLYAKGATGNGQTIGIVTLASVLPSDAEHFWNTTLGIATKASRITLDNVDGGSGPVSDQLGSGETTLDVEQSGALAPNANIIVYQAPNSDPGFADAFFDAASQNTAGTVSTSWGEAETVIASGIVSGTEPPAYAQAFDEAFLEMAAQGQSMFDTAGDAGAYDDSDELGTTQLDVDNPADSPWATVGGGTTLRGSIPLSSTVSARISKQRAWGWDWLWPFFALFSDPATNAPFTSEAAFAFTQAAGGGGGFSAFEHTPSYQRPIRGLHQFSAAEYLTPADPQPVGGLTLPTQWLFNATPPVITGHGHGRAVPDVSTNADPWTGYEEYFTGFTGDPLEVGWGGTSFVAPQLNGATSVIDSFVGHRVGFWNPAIYRFAAQHNSPFTPLDSASAHNTNLFYSGSPGHLYNASTGLGTPNLARLARDFKRH
jgi:kumamolisin